nr:MRN complex-interacting protein isoform X2 [Microcebus murinus]
MNGPSAQNSELPEDNWITSRQQRCLSPRSPKQSLISIIKSLHPADFTSSLSFVILVIYKGHIYDISLRSLEGPVGASEEEPVGHQQDDNVSLQEKPQTSESRWLKYLEKDSQKLELERVCFDRQPSSKTEPDCPFSQDLPRKRKWSQSTVQPPCSFDVQGLGNSEVTLEPQGCAGLIGKVKRDSQCLQNSVDCSTSERGAHLWELQSAAQRVKTIPSERTRILLSTEDSSHVDTEPQRLLLQPVPAGLV